MTKANDEVPICEATLRQLLVTAYADSAEHSLEVALQVCQFL